MAIEVEIKLKIEDSGELIKRLEAERFAAGKTVGGLVYFFWIA